MLRSWSILVLLAACGVEIDKTDDNTPSDAKVGSPVPIDAAADAPPDARPCTGGDASMMSGSSCFLMFNTPRSFPDAMAACMAIGTQLAVPADAAKYQVAKTLAGARDTWLGLTDQAQEGQFRWIDGTPLTFTSWDPTEPNNGGGNFEEDCGLIAGARMGNWDDRPCAPTVQLPNAGQYAYLCQF